MVNKLNQDGRGRRKKAQNFKTSVCKATFIPLHRVGVGLWVELAVLQADVTGGQIDTCVVNNA